ncbi:MAG: sensor histidine kinase [Flavobacteriales bacterium]
MRFSNPNSIAIYLALVTSVLATLIMFLIEGFNIDFINFKWFLLLVLLSICSFLLVNYVIKKYIFDRVNLLYKTINTSKTAFKVDTDLDSVNDKVVSFTNERQKEIDELRKMENFRREFLGNVSHELKTPIFNIQGYVHTLLDGAMFDDNVNVSYLERTSKSVDRMIAIVEDLVTISKIESNRLDLEMEKFDIVELVKHAFDLNEIKAKKANVSFTFSKEYSPIFVNADRDKITQVFTNLLVNSIKYGVHGGKTTVRFFDLGENILIEVADNGIGILQENLPRLFERFYRVDKSRSREQGGTGLGLAIVKHILDSHHQNINVRSALGKGTTFSFALKKSK